MLGHEVHLIPPSYVKQFVKRGKTGAADEEAISKAITESAWSTKRYMNTRPLYQSHDVQTTAVA